MSFSESGDKMREIKFRAFDETGKIMCQVVAIDWDNNGHIISAHLRKENGEIYKVYPNDNYGDKIKFLQYTGLKDCNGKEVYDGYIYKNNENGCIWVLSFDDYGLWATEQKNGSLYNSLPFRKLDLTNFEVIGNIYENKNLID